MFQTSRSTYIHDPTLGLPRDHVSLVRVTIGICDLALAIGLAFTEVASDASALLQCQTPLAFEQIVCEPSAVDIAVAHVVYALTVAFAPFKRPFVPSAGNDVSAQVYIRRVLIDAIAVDVVISEFSRVFVSVGHF
jgi:hypothetical protein